MRSHYCLQVFPFISVFLKTFAEMSAYGVDFVDKIALLLRNRLLLVTSRIEFQRHIMVFERSDKYIHVINVPLLAE
jgi:hypothetical protein